MPKLQFIKGGSSAEPERGFACPFVQQGVKATELRSKETYRFRILPAFDDTVDMNDAAFKSSFVSYRDANKDVDPLTKTEGFNEWYFILSGYTFLGRLQKGFLSPYNGYQGRPYVGQDPIIDCRTLARKSTDPAIKALTEKPLGTKGSAIIPDMRRWAFFNTYMEKDNEWFNSIGYFSQMGMDDLKKKLCIKAGRRDKTICEAWPDYLYGDPTDPMTGLVATSKKAKPNDNTQGIETSCIFFSKKPQTLDGSEVMSIDPASENGKAILEGRYLIADTTNVLKIATYQEILNYIVEDGTIPYNIIEQACSEHGQVPPQPASAREASYSTPPPVADDDLPEPGHSVANKAAPASTGVGQPKSTAAPVPAGGGKAPPPAIKYVSAPAPVKTSATAPVKTSAPVAKSHAALQSQEPAAAPTEAGRSRWEELVKKFTNNTSGMAPEEFQELSTLSQIYANSAAPEAVAA